MNYSLIIIKIDDLFISFISGIIDYSFNLMLIY